MEPVIRVAIADTLAALNWPVVDFVVEHPADFAHGDYATNVAMVLGKTLGQSPRTVAEQLIAALTDQIEYVDRIELAGPGFINFHLGRDFFAAELERIVAAKDEWGRHDAWTGKTVIVEYTDPNPFKELHIGHVVPNALGETIARLFMYAGADTKRVTFQGDVGMHVAKAMYGLEQLGATVETIDAPLLGQAYALGAQAFDADEAAKIEITRLNKVIYTRSDEAVNALYDAGKAVSLAYFEAAYHILDSRFDHNFFESVTGPLGLEIVQKHIGTIFTESEGAVIFKGEEYGLHTRVFINKEGLPTYETKDVGLIAAKAAWCPFDLAVTVTGTEQREYFKVTTKASELIQPDLAGKVELFCNGMMRLPEGKMSSRTGNVIRATDLIGDVQAVASAKMNLEADDIVREAVAEAVAVAAIKYSILKVAPGKDIIFEREKALSFEGDSGPYLQYTHARIASVLEKAKAAGVAGSASVIPETVYELEKIVYQFPEVVAESLRERAPHKLVVYLTWLASAFNSFYSAEKIADASDQHAPYKALLAEAVQVTLKNGLWLLAIKALDRM